MLNISENSITPYVRLEEFRAFNVLKKSRIRRLPLILTILFLVGIFLCMFLPWTQNINSKGYVTTRLPSQRPQAIQSVISGRLDKWYVREGDFVELGDTIAFLSEIKSEYFDPQLVVRTSEQVDAKSQSIKSYGSKVKALDQQYTALEATLELKREQIRNKIEQGRYKIAMDSIDLTAYRTNLEIADNQYNRIKELYEKGLKTLSDLQEKDLKRQQTAAKVTVQENKLLNTRNELMNSFIELSTATQEYADKLAKSQSDRQSAVSARLESVAATSKLQSQLSNYSERQQFYYITAPQSGYITKTIKKGIGEIIKEGADLATIMPSDYDFAVEVYLKPQDTPLLDTSEQVRLRFDGWPALVISGWPESSTGIFSGKIFAIDRFISDNGYYRVLVVPDETDEKDWPKELRVGTGVQSFILLNDVPIWYELWRQLNGFPPDFYDAEKKKKKNIEGVKRKAPLKSVK